MDRNLIALGQELAAQQNDLVRGRIDQQRARARLLASVDRRASVWRVGRVVAVAALLFGAAAVGFFWRPATSYYVGADASAGITGEWIAAPRNGSVPLSFADGTRLVLLSNGRARVTHVDMRGATIVVERGELRASVHPRQGNHWRIDVGPFRVIVVGTVFDVSWQPDVERFTLRLRKGAVTVAGPVVGGDRLVRAGEQLSVSVSKGELTSSRIEESVRREGGTLTPASVAPEPASVAPEPAPVAPDPADVEPAGNVAFKGTARSAAQGPIVPPAAPTASAQIVLSQTESSPPSSATKSATREGSNAASTYAHAEHDGSLANNDSAAAAQRLLEEFRNQARAHRYREAFATAERYGFDAICATGGASDVLLLGDVARLVGSVERAQQAYSKLRQRFSGAPAAHGAFMLGRIAHDQRNAFAEAARYFSLYLREAPEGAFAREAASRLVEVRTLAGDRDGARAAAARYVELYPAGPYAEKAREVMAGP